MIQEKYYSRVKETSFNVTQTAIDSIRTKDIEKTSFRVYDKGCIGVAGAIGQYDEAHLKEKAIAALEQGITYDFEVGSNLVKNADLSPVFTGQTPSLHELEELLSELRRRQPEFFFSNKINMVEHEVKMENDRGLDLHYKDAYYSIVFLIKEKASANIMDAEYVVQARTYDRRVILREINEICDGFKRVVELPAEGKLPVVFYTHESLPFQKLISELNGKSYGSKSSLLYGKLGQQVFNEAVSFYQSNNSVEKYGPCFDKEGVVNIAGHYPLVENGVFVAPFTDKRTAHKYGLELTGAAGAEYDGVPRLSYPDFKIVEGEKTARELLDGKMGVLVMIASGGDYTPEGKFASPVQLAYLFDGERIVGKLPELQISSDLFKMYGEDFVGVSQDSVSELMDSKYLVMNMDVKLG